MIGQPGASGGNLPTRLPRRVTTKTTKMTPISTAADTTPAVVDGMPSMNVDVRVSDAMGP
jgi:hypothetical protein